MDPKCNQVDSLCSDETAVSVCNEMNEDELAFILIAAGSMIMIIADKRYGLPMKAENM